MTTDDKRIIVALDFSDEAETLGLLDRLDPARCRAKVGKELFTRCGPALVRRIIERGFEVFLDLKFHDIPNTVAGAVRAAAELGVWMLNVHASGGSAMLRAAREAAREAAGEGSGRPLLIAVTVLTSLEAGDLHATGVSGEPREQVLRLARLASASGLDGVVCSARETPDLRRALPPGFVLVTPGIRPAGDAAGDQKRIETPASAIAQGSSYLVIGRPITQAADPAAKLESILREIDQAAG